MYQLKNGILYHNGKAEMALGQSYYASYHFQKVPVPEGGDREGEMATDLKAMRDAGFNICRMAALGDVAWNEKAQKAEVRFPLPDRFCQLCDTLDMASMIRLQGYSMNLRNFTDATMLNQNNEEMPFHWSWFVRNSLCHPGIREDNENGTIESARHFNGQGNLVSFQIYNEPAYPNLGFYDYHPYAIAAWREWLWQKGYYTKEEALEMEPPRKRPTAEESEQNWVLWRLFHQETLNEYLCAMGRCAKEGNPVPETLTCHMTCPFVYGNAIRGEDYFTTAEGMDILGITHYLPCRGPEMHLAAMVLDGAESAAAMFGKHAWLIEYNARTNMPPIEWERETYLALGRGIKGILYYQWRADYPFPESPEPEGFGLTYNDGRKTPVYPTALTITAMVQRLGEKLALAEKARCGLAILYSNYANAYYDAKDNGCCDGNKDAHDRFTTCAHHVYVALNEIGLVPDSVRACDLQKNTLQIKTLVLPSSEGLSAQEIAQIEAFIANGGQAYVWNDSISCFSLYEADPAPRLHGIVYNEYDAATLMAVTGMTPPALCTHPLTDARLVCSQGYAIAALCNRDPLERTVSGAKLTVTGNYTQAVFYSIDYLNGTGLPVCNGCVTLPDYKAGGLILYQ